MQVPQDPDFKKRPDITAFNLPNYGRPILLDVMITCPVPSRGGHINIPQASRKLRAANSAFNAKQNKYADVVKDGTYGFVPLIFESTGTLHPVTRKLLVQVIKAGANRDGRPFGSHCFFWMSALQVALQRSIACGFLKRAASVNGRVVRTWDTSPDFITDFRSPIRNRIRD